jgi:hypothetical protein
VDWLCEVEGFSKENMKDSIWGTFIDCNSLLFAAPMLLEIMKIQAHLIFYYWSITSDY